MKKSAAVLCLVLVAVSGCAYGQYAQQPAYYAPAPAYYYSLSAASAMYYAPVYAPGLSYNYRGRDKTFGINSYGGYGNLYWRDRHNSFNLQY